MPRAVAAIKIFSEPAIEVRAERGGGVDAKQKRSKSAGGAQWPAQDLAAFAYDGSLRGATRDQRRRIAKAEFPASARLMPAAALLARKGLSELGRGAPV